MLHCDVLLSGQQQNHWLAKALPLQTLWTEWFQMSFKDMKVHCQREKMSVGSVHDHGKC